MSVRYEWMYDPAVHYVPAGTEVGEFVTDTEALLIAADEVTVIEGDLDAFADRISRAIQQGRSTP